MEFIVRRVASIGDAIVASVVVQKLREAGHAVRYQTHGNIHAVMRFCPDTPHLEMPRGFVHVNLDGCYEKHPDRTRTHFHELFLGAANHQLHGYGLNLRNVNALPRLVVSQETKAITQARFNTHHRPWIFCCPRSNSYRVRQTPDGLWSELLPLLPGTKFWMGQHPAPAGFVDLKLQSLTPLVEWTTAADLIISVDTGPAHIAAALGIPMVMLGQSSSPELHFSDLRDFETVWPEGNLTCLNCQKNLCPIAPYAPPCQNFSAERIAELVKKKLDSHRIAALIPTFNADAHRLNKAILNVIDQVDEVVLTCPADGQVPALPKHPKLRLVNCPRSQIGFGKNVNYGMRHTSAPWVLVLNDDCYLNGDCVQQLRSLCAPDVGMIAHLLRYPNGTIYFAGRTRRPGERGFPHLNHRDYHPSISSVSEMEALSATSVLVNRKAFYAVGGFDERFFMYAEDDDLSMRMRQAGFRLLYHPVAMGVHEGSATVKQTGKQWEWIKTSSRLMEELWGWYWTKNKDTIPGVFT